MADAPVPAERLAVAREVDQRVARDALVADGARQPAQLVGVVEVTRGLEKAQRPARRQRRPPQQLRHLAHEAAQVGADQEVPRQRPAGRRVGDADPAVRASDREGGVGGRVEEQRVAPVGDQQRYAQVRAGAVAELGVPQLAHRPRGDRGVPALPQTIEVLLAREREAHAGAARRGLARSPASRGLVQERRPGRVGERQPHRRRRDLDAKRARGQPHRLAVDDLERHLRPVARVDERRRRRRPVAGERHADDARAADADPGGAEVQRRALAREARHAVVSQRTPGPRRLTTRSGACAPVSAHRSGTGTPAPA